MSKNISWQLLAKFVAGESSAEENLQVKNWSETSDKNKQILDEAFKIYKHQEFQQVDFDVKSAKLKLIESINKEGKQVQMPTSNINWWRVAASVLIVVGLSLTGYFVLQQTKKEVWIQRTTQEGEMMEITLPDGSLVHLNAGSSLSYIEDFEGASRKVKLNGEAFFEVERDTLKPFTVETAPLTTTVLGTSFNIRSYKPDSSATVSVISGKVKVDLSENQLSQTLYLSPNNQAKWKSNSVTLTVQEVEASDLIAWKEGIIKFKDRPFREAAKELERWFGVKIQFENNKIESCLITAEFKNENLKAVLESLCLTAELKYVIKDRTVLISGAGC